MLHYAMLKQLCI